MSKILMNLALIPLLFSLFACKPTEASVVVTPRGAYTAGPPPDVTAIVRDYPRVDGSTSAHPLQIVVACKILGVACMWVPPLFSERRIYPIIDSASPQAVEKVTAIQHSGTHDAYVNLIERNTDLILVARLPSDDELQAARAKHVRLDVRPIALDAFVFLVHKDNPLESLSLDQIRDIYSGQVTDWSTLGGTGQINAYQRDRNSGSQELMEDLVMKGMPMVEAPDMIFETMVGPINAIHNDPLGIGYSVYYYAAFMLPDENVRLLGVDGVIPTSETIASRDYPLVTEVYAVVRADMSSTSPAILLRDWLLIPAGQEAVSESGYVPIR